MTTETKTLLTSKTFWGVVVTVLAGLLPHLGLAINEGSALELAEQFALIAGAGMAIYGRITATQQIQ